MTSQLLERTHIPTSNGQLFRSHGSGAVWDFGDETRYLWAGTPSLPRRTTVPQILSCTADTLDDRYALFITNPTVLACVDVDEPVRIDFRTSDQSSQAPEALLASFIQRRAWLTETVLKGLSESVSSLRYVLDIARPGDTSKVLATESDLTPRAYEVGTSPSHTQPHDALDAIARWTRLPPDELGFLWGASRRSIYNWLDRKPIKSPEIADLIVQTYEELSPMQGSRDPLYFRQWLKDGEPPPTALIRRRLWRDLRARIGLELSPLLPMESMHPSLDEKTVGYGDEALRSISHALRASLPVAPVVRPSWSPREVTGLGGDEDEESEL